MTLWTVADWAPLSMGFPRQEYWNGFTRPFPGDLPDPGIKPMPLSPLQWQAGPLLLAPPAELQSSDILRTAMVRVA